MDVELKLVQTKAMANGLSEFMPVVSGNWVWLLASMLFRPAPPVAALRNPESTTVPPDSMVALVEYSTALKALADTQVALGSVGLYTNSQNALFVTA